MPRLLSITIDISLLLNPFFEDEDHLSSKGNRLHQIALALVGRTKGSDLEQPFQRFAKRLGMLLQQCKTDGTVKSRNCSCFVIPARGSCIIR
jgi:hypothetical protein